MPTRSAVDGFYAKEFELPRRCNPCECRSRNSGQDKMDGDRVYRRGRFIAKLFSTRGTLR